MHKIPQADKQSASDKIADESPPEVAWGRPVADNYPDVTLVSYMETSDGIVTSIYRHWPKPLWSGRYHGNCSCSGNHGHCLVQVKGKVDPRDAPLFDQNWTA